MDQPRRGRAGGRRPRLPLLRWGGGSTTARTSARSAVFVVAGEKAHAERSASAARAAPDDESVSPVVRQTLLHWAYELTEADFAGARPRRSRGVHAARPARPRDEEGAAGRERGDRGTPPDEADGRIATERRKKAEEAAESREERAAKRKER